MQESFLMFIVVVFSSFIHGFSILNFLMLELFCKTFQLLHTHTNKHTKCKNNHKKIVFFYFKLEYSQKIFIFSCLFSFPFSFSFLFVTLLMYDFSHPQRSDVEEQCLARVPKFKCYCAFWFYEYSFYFFTSFQRCFHGFICIL